MTTVTRDWLNAHMPPGTDLHLRALDIIKCPDSLLVYKGLEWLAAQTEADRFPRPPWKEMDPNKGLRHEDAWSVQMDGLSYKSESQYLTSEGWYLGMACWYVRIECGYRQYIAHELPAVALQRAIVFFDITRKWRDTDPLTRTSPMQMIEEMKIVGRPE